MSRFRWLVRQVHQRSLWQVLAIYAASSWVVLQVAHTLSASLALPDWFAPLAFILLLIGLPVVLATAFIQEGRPGPGDPGPPPTGGASATPASAPAAAAHPGRWHRWFTWRNAIAGGIIAFALWGVGAAGWLIIRGPAERAPGVGGEGGGLPSRIVVLPFENLGGETDHHFAEGMTEEVTARLARVGGLGVIARTSALQYRGAGKTVREIGEELGVDYLLEGTVRWEHSPDGMSRVRVTPQLIRVSDETHLWAEVYDEPLAGVFAVQSEIARKVVDALGITLLERERRSVDAQPTAVLEAYDIYLRGLAVWELGPTEENYVAAIDLFDRAVALDPTFAVAWARLSRAHAAMFWYHWDRSEDRLARARHAADRAIDLAPGLADGHQVLGWYHYWGHLDYDRALEQFRTALEIEPRHPEALWGTGAVRRRQGRMEEAIAAFQAAFGFDPRSATIANNLGQAYHLLRQYAQADSAYALARSLSPGWGRAYGFAAYLHVDWTGDTRRARQLLDELPPERSARDEPFVIQARVLVDLIDGEYGAALAFLDSVAAPVLEEQFFFVPAAQLRAQVHQLMGRTDLAAAYHDSARALVEAELRQRPFADARLHGALGLALAGLGRHEEAVSAGLLGIALLPLSREAWRGAYRVEELARIYTMVGDHDLAIDQLELLLARPSQLSANRLRVDPSWAPLRDHPRFARLVRDR